MNANDKQNLMFLLTVPEEGLKMWMKQASPDDIDYAIELVKAYRLALDEAAKYDNLEPVDLKEANDVLARFRLSK